MRKLQAYRGLLIKSELAFDRMGGLFVVHHNVASYVPQVWW